MDKRFFFTMGGLLCVLGLGVACLTLFSPTPYWLIKGRWAALQEEASRASNAALDHSFQVLESKKDVPSETFAQVQAEQAKAMDLVRRCKEARREAFAFNIGIAVVFVVAGLIMQRKGISKKVEAI
jgi:hypothetical protein